jgi:glutaredoxin
MRSQKGKIPHVYLNLRAGVCRKERGQVKLEKYAKKVPGKRKGDILLFALSTCGWCRKTKNLLDTLGVGYRYIDVDLLDGEAKKEVVAELDRWDPGHSFPCVVIDDDKCIVGFQEDKIRQAVSGGKN